jgi:hypothetical protein
MKIFETFATMDFGNTQRAKLVIFWQIFETFGTALFGTTGT